MLRGAGASVALPWLECMLPLRQSAAPPVRLAVLFMPNGVLPSHWTPKKVGREFELTPTLEPLANVREQLLVLTNLRNRNSLAGEGHYVKTTALLSGAPVHKTGGRDLRCGTSIDQLAARERGHLTRLPSMVLGIDPVRFAEDMGYSTVYGAHVSWRSPTQPATKEIHPRLAFDRLFRSSRLGRSAADRSVLDIVAEDARRLQRELGGADRHKLDEYFEAVRALEQRVERFSAQREQDLGELGDAARPEDTVPGFPEHVRLMLDLIALAFRTDTTRIASFMFGNAVSPRDFSFVDGVRGSHHGLSHHENNAQKKAMYQRINRWHVAQYAYLLEQLAAIPDGDGTLLDSSMVMFASGIRDGQRHDPNNLPILLAGRGGGAIDSGRHLLLRRHRPLCDLYVSMLRAFGVPVDRFGDSDKPLTLA